MLRLLLSCFLCFAVVAHLCIPSALAEVKTCSNIVPLRKRSNIISIIDFGGVGDGRTSNTKAFREAIYQIRHLRRRGGTLLYIPPGVYLTGSFNLTSHMTLYLAPGAVIKATQVCTVQYSAHVSSLFFFSLLMYFLFVKYRMSTL